MPDAKVLLVDDDPVILKLLQVNFEMEGYDVITANDGLEGLEKARAERPDIVLLDIMMPRMDGWEVLEHLKEDAATSSIPVVLLTARTSEEDQIRGWGEGILEYLSKPFNPQRLVEWAEQAMTPRNMADEDERRQRAVEQLRLLKELRRRQ